MRITGEDKEGKRELDNFINPEERYPVIATTSKLMTTGVDAQTCKLIVLDTNIESPRNLNKLLVEVRELMNNLISSFSQSWILEMLQINLLLEF